MALTTALSWNSCIRNIIDYAIPLPRESIMVGVLYAIIMTLILIGITALLPDTTTQLPTTTKELLERMQDKDELQHLRAENTINQKLANINELKKISDRRKDEKMANLLYFS